MNERHRTLSRRRALSAVLLGAGGLATGSAATASNAGQERAGAVKVLAAHPVAYAVTRHLVEGSPVVLERAAPQTLPPTRHAAYFGGRGEGALRTAARGADAVVGLRSVWPEDPLFPLARRANIRIVEIDAARPVDGALPGVTLRPGNPGDGQHAWLDPTNLGRMADIVAHDLKQLAPGSASTIGERSAAFKREVVELTAKAGQALARLDDVAVYSLSDRLDHFVAGFNLDLVGRDARDDTAWTPDALAALSQRLRGESVSAVLHHREPAQDVARAVSDAGAQLVVLSTQGIDPLSELSANAELVIKGLAGG